MVNVALRLCMPDQDDALGQHSVILRRGTPAHQASNLSPDRQSGLSRYTNILHPTDSTELHYTVHEECAALATIHSAVRDLATQQALSTLIQVRNMPWGLRARDNALEIAQAFSGEWTRELSNKRRLCIIQLPAVVEL